MAQTASGPETAAAHANGAARPRESFWALTVGSIGVVYGDIGTSPLYAFREAVVAASGEGGPVTREAVLGVLSLILWSLIVVVTLKYVLILLRADNHGEGGTLSLTALAFRALGRRTGPVFFLGVVGAAMFYGDSFLTPAISVLSAVEGLKIVTPAFEPYVVPITVGILIALFAVQSRGTAKVSAFFGPITIVWFLAIAVAGLIHIADDPRVLAAINPWYAISFLASHGIIGLVTLGAVFLAVTGGEALYADLGHFGRKPIQFAWLGLVFPALVINYFGQGALVMANPAAIENPFYRLVPEQMLIPMVLLATAATVIASQAVITGAFSITQQAIQLGLLPRLAIRHTSETHLGQIYVPRVNFILLIGVLLLVGLFRSSSALASAYGIAVSTTMVVDGILAFVVIWKLWQWKPWSAALLVLPFVIVDTTFLSANLLKLFEGAAVPVLFGAVTVFVILTWRRGTNILAQKTRRIEVPFAPLSKSLEKKPPHMVAGTAVFLTSDPQFAPTALLHNLKHNKVLHEHNVILTIVTADKPRVSQEDRVQILQSSPHFMRVVLTFGFMETPNVPKAFALARKLGWTFDIMSTSFFLSRRSLRPEARGGIPRLQDRLFIALARSADDASNYFHIPSERVVEIGTQVTV
ncbi:MAG TPA: potassium transporter Kup [Xanthobacteraceae bacterium]|jgi:KUP system potassium uptake protein